MDRESFNHTFHIDVVHASVARGERDDIRVSVEDGGAASVDLWLPSLQPSEELWRRFSYDDFLWREFCRRYRLELERQPSESERLRSLACENRMALTYLAGDRRHNVAIAVKQHLENLECRRRYAAGWIIGGLTWPVRDEIHLYGGLWFARHRAWTMPSYKSWKHIQSLLPGDF